jgi:Mu transposase, C-terminal
MTNPFRSTSVFNLPLTLSVCQQMHAAALLRVARGMEADGVPGSVPAVRLRELLHRFGTEVCLAHPAEIEQRFRGVTLSVYERIEALYCSRLARSIQMVTRILDAMAQCENRTPVHEEAIWAICLYLDERRLQQTGVTTQKLDATWWIGEIVPGAPATAAGEDKDDASRYALVGVIDVSHARVLAFRGGAHGSEAELSALSLYDALVHARLPHALGAGGLVWQVPTCLVATGILSEACKASCASLGMRIERASFPVPLTQDLQQLWTDMRMRLAVAPARWAVVFDSALNRAYGTSPLRKREEADRRFGRLTGYQSDPASLVPGLRALLPLHEAEILQEGEVIYDGLHYADDLLSHFPGSRVAVRRSEQSEAAIWVYLDGEMLCQATARELARRDGSYRSHRPGR